MRTYNIKCNATLHTTVDAVNRTEAKKQAMVEFIGYLKFLDKGGDPTWVSSPVENLEVELADI